MSLTFPISLPSQGFAAIEWLDCGAVGIQRSPYTAEQQIYDWPGQWWEVRVTYPPMRDGTALGEILAFLRSLNGPSGTFYLGDSIRRTPRGSIAGTVTVGSGATANSTTLPLSGGTGSFAVGDWLQIDANSAARLHQVVKVNAGSVDVFPRLRSAHANGTSITYNSPKGVFRLVERSRIPFDSRRVAHGITFAAREAL